MVKIVFSLLVSAVMLIGGLANFGAHPWIGTALALAALVRVGWLFAGAPSRQRSARVEFDQRSAALTYKHWHAGTGIAVDTAQQQLLLAEGGRVKAYAFADVRRWETNQQQNTAYGTGFAGMAVMAGTAASNRANSGLFVEVRDLDAPRWRIAFAQHKLQKALPRWMEILRQTLNEESRP